MKARRKLSRGGKAEVSVAVRKCRGERELGEHNRDPSVKVPWIWKTVSMVRGRGPVLASTELLAFVPAV